MDLVDEVDSSHEVHTVHFVHQVHASQFPWGRALVYAVPPAHRSNGAYPMDRRDFLKLGAASAAGLVGPAVRAAEEQAQMPATTATAIQPFTFAVLSDPHCAEGPKPGIEQLGDSIQKFLRCSRQIAGMPAAERPDFMIVTGDIHPEALKDHLAEFTVPMHVIAGNHESGPAREQLRALFLGDFVRGRRETDYYAFVHKGVRFIGVCDVGAGGDHVGHLCSEDINPRGQCEWLEGQLAEPEPRKIVFSHIPTEPDGKDRGMYLGRNDSVWFNALIERAQPHAMFFGHLHTKTTERRVGRTRSFVLRSCSWNGDRSPIGYMLVKVTADGLDVQEVDTGAYA